ncbi:MAG: hypothetical protein WCI67_18935, partial [Chloroflexales bacterium]
SSSAQVEPPRPPLRPGASVRLLDSDHLGQIAQVRTISSAPRRVASRAVVAAVEVVGDDGVALWLPRTCVEVLS